MINLEKTTFCLVFLKDTNFPTKPFFPAHEYKNYLFTKPTANTRVSNSKGLFFIFVFLIIKSLSVQTTSRQIPGFTRIEHSWQPTTFNRLEQTSIFLRKQPSSFCSISTNEGTRHSLIIQGEEKFSFLYNFDIFVVIQFLIIIEKVIISQYIYIFNQENK